MYPALVAISISYGVVYINLDARVDRRTALRDELRSANITNAARVSAVQVPRYAGLTSAAIGALGCSLSHIKALRTVRSDVTLVLEDDITLLRAMPDQELRAPSFDWDVLMFAYNGGHTRECVKAADTTYCRVKEAQTRSMYAVRQRYIPHLLAVFNTSAVGLRSGGSQPRFAGDQTWKVLQRTAGHNWFAAVPRVGIQRPGYSDIERSVKNYGV